MENTPGFLKVGYGFNLLEKETGQYRFAPLSKLTLSGI